MKPKITRHGITNTPFSSAFVFSPLNTGIYTAAKPANSSAPLVLAKIEPKLLYFSIAGTIALGFMTDSTGFLTNGPPFDNGVSLSEAPSCLQESTASSTPNEPAKQS